MRSVIVSLIGAIGLIIIVAMLSAPFSPPPPPTAPIAATPPATSPATTTASPPNTPDTEAQAAAGPTDPVQFDAAKARRVAQACWRWAQDHHQQMPDDLATLILNGFLSPSDLVVARIGTDPLDITPDELKQAAKDPTAFAQKLEPHCDYVYLGKGLGPNDLKQPAVVQQVAILYEKPSARLQGRMNIGFIDGHVFIRLISRLPAAFRQSNDFFARTKRPLIDVNAMQTAATK